MKAKIVNWIAKVKVQMGVLLTVVDPTVAQMKDLKDLAELLALLQAALTEQP